MRIKSIKGFDAGIIRIQPLFQTRRLAGAGSPGCGKLAIPIGCYTRTGCIPPVQLSHDAVVLIKEGRARRASFSGAVLPLTDSPMGIAVVYGVRKILCGGDRVFVKGDFFDVPAGMMDGC